MKNSHQSFQGHKNATEKFFNASGRLRRSTFFFRTFFLGIPQGIIYANLQTSDWPGQEILALTVFIICGVLIIVQSVKRLHDINLSGWYYLLFFIPFVNIAFSFYITFKDGTIGPNKYGEDPKKNERDSKANSTGQYVDPAFDTKINKNKSRTANVEQTERHTANTIPNSQSNLNSLNYLEKLAELKEKDIITEKEFLDKKKQILDL